MLMRISRVAEEDILWKIWKAVIAGEDSVEIVAGGGSLIFFAVYGDVSDGEFQVARTHSRPGLVPSSS